MRSRFSLILCAAVLLVQLATTTLAQPARDQQLVDQVRFILTEVPARHPNFFHVVSRSEFRSAGQALEADVPTISDEEFYVRLCGLVAMGRDSHTNLHSVAFAPQIGFRPLPVNFKWFEEGVYVTGAVGEHVYLNGARLLQLGDTPTHQVLDRLRVVVAHENEYWFRYRSAFFLRSQGVLRGIGVAPLAEPAPLSFQLRSGTQTALDLSPLSGPLVRPVDERPGFTPVLARRIGENYWYEYWPETRILYIAYRRCREMSEMSIAQFAETVATVIDQYPIDSMVFDLRINPGGNSSLFPVLLGAVRSRAATLFQNGGFRAYGLIDGGTNSSGMWAAYELERPYTWDFTPVTTIGQPTGGKPEHYGEVLAVELPHTGLTLVDSTKFWSPPPHIPVDDAVKPNLPTRLRATDHFARHDAEMAMVLARIGLPPEPPSGDLVVVNGASFRAETGIAPGSVAAAFGHFSAGRVDVLVNGTAASILGASPAHGQVVLLVPEGTAEGRAAAELWQAGVKVGAGEFTVTPAGPGLFVTQPGDVTQPGAVLNQDGALNGAGMRSPRDSIIQVFATGSGPLDRDGQTEVRVWIAQYPAEVIYSGPAPGLPGVWQINARVPAGLAITGEVPMFIAAHGLMSNPVTIWIE